MTSQRFCLRWNNHQSNLLSVFDQLLHAETFTDVTLAVDGQYLKAHKMVLSACSPYFNALFVNHPEKHPIVILKDVPYADMKSLLDFMYRGEVSVDQERLTAFLKVAESLRIKGLTEVNDDKPLGTSTPNPSQVQRVQPYVVQQRNKAQDSLGNLNNNSASLLGSALCGQKRKRGRPRKLSGSSNGTGNDFDEFERDIRQGSPETIKVKPGSELYSGNEGSDDNMKDQCDNAMERSSDHMDTHDSNNKQSRSKDDKDNDNTSDPNDSDADDHMDSSYMEPQLMLDEYDEPVEFKYDPNTDSTNLQESVPSMQHQQQQNMYLLTQQQKRQMQLPAGLGVAKGGAVIGAGPVPGTVTILNSMSMVDIPKLTPIVKTTKQMPKLAKRPKLKQNGLSQVDQQPLNNNDFIDVFGSNFLGTGGQGQAQWGQNQPTGGSNSKSRHSTGSRDTGNNICVNNSPELSQRLFGATKAIAPPPIEILDPMQHLPTALGLRHRLAIPSTPPARAVQQKNDSLNNNSSSIQTEEVKNSISKESRTPSPTKTVEIIDEQDDIEIVNQPVQKPQRRRIRRKAQSSIDDQAEHLTEMSVRGLDLFRYASIAEGVYKCTECAKENVQKTFKNKYSFQRHAFLYHEGKHRKVFPCPLCGKEFSRPDKMKNHMKTTHECFVPKDQVGSYHPLNYLITAAAAGEFAQMYPHLDSNNSSTSGALNDHLSDNDIKTDRIGYDGLPHNHNGANNEHSIKALKETEKV